MLAMPHDQPSCYPDMAYPLVLSHCCSEVCPVGHPAQPPLVEKCHVSYLLPIPLPESRLEPPTPTPHTHTYTHTCFHVSGW